MKETDDSGRMQGRDDLDEPLWSRWARRKEQARRGLAEPDPVVAAQPAEEPPLATVRVDPRTGKTHDELTDEDMPPIESLDSRSDLSVFMARNISPVLRAAALSKVFHSPDYNKYCLCAEYAEDYTQFAALGDIVPHELKATIAREAARLREALLERGQEISQAEAEAQIRAEREAGLPRSVLPEPEASLSKTTLS